MDKVREAILFLIALILSITVHEFGHAWMATRLGDPTPREQGRFTLLPLRHIDPIGTIVFPLLMVFTSIPLLGWGKPVQTQPRYYTRRFTTNTGSMLVAVAGPAMNLLLALVVSLLVMAGVSLGWMTGHLALEVLERLVLLNLVLMVFNLLPIPPLDGGQVLAWVLPRSMQGVMDVLQRFGFLILLGLLFTGGFRYVLRPVFDLYQIWVSSLISLLGGLNS